MRKVRRSWERQRELQQVMKRIRLVGAEWMEQQQEQIHPCRTDRIRKQLLQQVQLASKMRQTNQRLRWQTPCPSDPICHASDPYPSHDHAPSYLYALAWSASYQL